MKKEKYVQEDLFEGFLTHEMIQMQKIKELEDKQDTLRRGLFRRFTEQEKRINSLSENVEHLISLVTDRQQMEFIA